MKHQGFLFLLCFGISLSAESVSFPFTEQTLSTAEILGDGVWEIRPLSDRGGVLYLKESGQPPQEPVRRPANILLLPTKPVAAFELNLEFKSTVSHRNGADVIVVFGFQNETHYYYIHISNDSDNRTHHIIMKVEGTKKIRTPVQLEKDPESKLNGEWQKMRVTRDSEGNIAVYVDDMETPTLTAEDRTWLKGKIGIGSFNDPAMFDAIELEL